MPDSTLQTPDGPDRLTGTSSEPGDEPRLAERLITVLDETMIVIEDLPADDTQGLAVLGAARRCAAAAAERFVRGDEPDRLAGDLTIGFGWIAHLLEQAEPGEFTSERARLVLRNLRMLLDRLADLLQLDEVKP